MNSSLFSRRILGIPVGIHWSALLPGFIVASGISGGLIPATGTEVSSSLAVLIGIVGAVAFGAAILAHEFGHALVARQRGVGVHDIKLFALGGVARLERDPDTPRDALHVAAAGPAVSAAIAAAAFATALLAGAAGSALVATLLTWFGLVNAIMVVFNLIPAAPLDGGRILQAALWKRSGDRWTSTITATRAGRAFGWILVGVGLVQMFGGGGFSGLWPIMVGWFILRAARAERRHAQHQLRLAAQRNVVERGIFSDPFIADLLARHGARPVTTQAPRARPGHGAMAGRTIIDV